MLLLWLILSAFLLGIPVFLGSYLPLGGLAGIAERLPGAARFASACRKAQRRIFLWCVRRYVGMQPWFDRCHFDFENLDQAKRAHSRVFLVANHRSHLDVFLVISHVLGARILAKTELFRVPVLGFMMRQSRQIPAAKGSLPSLRKAMMEARRGIEDGESVLVFPEFTRCPEGFRGVGDFSLLPFQVAREANAWVVPLAFRGTDLVWPKGSLKLRSGPRVDVRALAAVDASRYANASDLRDEVRHRILGALEGSA